MKFFIKFLSSFVFMLFVWLCVVYFQTSKLTASSQWVWDAYEKKTKIAKSIDGKKIIIVAGSNALFGCDSKMLSKAFGMPVVNYGVNAGVMLPYTLYKAKSVINNGDIVLMPLEYPMYDYDGDVNEQMIDYIFSRDVDAFYSLRVLEQFYMVWNITFKRIYDGYKALGGSKVKVGLYGAQHIDKFGDQNRTELRYRSAAIYKELDTLKANTYGAKFSKDALSWKYLEEFHKYCEKRDVRVIFMPSTLMWFDSYKDDKKERWFYENLSKIIKKRGWEFVGEPYKYMYDKELYFNTDFHLINRAREMRTKQMILDLKSSAIKK